MTTFSLERAALEEILAHARRLHPEECCGAVVSAGGRDRVWQFTNIQSRLHTEHPGDHPRDGRTAYTPEPKELLAVLRAGEAPGAALKLFYHSHSVRGSYFSGEDRARAMFGDEPAYPDVGYLVVSDARTAGEARVFAWSEEGHDFVECPLEIVGG